MNVGECRLIFASFPNFLSRFIKFVTFFFQFSLFLGIDVEKFTQDYLIIKWKMRVEDMHSKQIQAKTSTIRAIVLNWQPEHH